MSEDMSAQLTEALDNHEVTNDEGQVAEPDTTTETPELEEQTTEKEPAQGDTPAEVSEEDDSEQVAEDDSGKRYVPKSRFDKIYGKMKEYERQVKSPLPAGLPPLNLPQAPDQSKGKPQKVDKTDQLENELLFTTLPQFDPMSDAMGNPTNPDYNPVLDQMAFEIYKARPGLTKIQAGKLALHRAKQLSGQIEGVRSEARSVKSQQSDQGITTRVVSRNATQVDPDKMSDIEIENYLRTTGQW